jgi:hypothetical protein
MFADFLIAYGMVQLFIYRRTAAKLLGMSLLLCLIISVFINRKEYRKALSLSRRDITYYTRFLFLEKTINKNDAVLTDLSTGLYVPTFNGKVIANPYPLYWVNDIQQRRDDVRLFFSAGINDTTRSLIINRYKPDYILIDHRYFSPDSSFVLWLRKNGKVVREENQLELIQLRVER